MTATNHALTGALIGLGLGNPLLAVPLALVSHFACDAIPHFGSAIEDAVFFRTRHFKVLLSSDALFCTSLVVVLATTRPTHWLLASICAFIATSPDILWLGAFIDARQNRDIVYKHWLLRLAKNLQWFQRPIGVFVEVTWFIGALALLIPQLH